MSIGDLLNWRFGLNPLYLWLLAVALMAAVVVCLGLVRRLVVRILRNLTTRTQTDVYDLVVRVAGHTHALVLWVIGLYAGASILTLPDRLTRLVGHLAVLALLVQAASWGATLVGLWIDRYVRLKSPEDPSTAATIRVLGGAAKVGVWALAVLLALQNLEIEITPLLAGLGVGGIAIALAVQNILGDLFASLTIMLDKPFVAGDFIIVGEFLGTVEHVGLKTTRVRSLSGEQLVFSNNDLLQSRIRNYKRMFERRIIFTFGVTYQTPYEQVAAIPGMVKDIITGLEKTRFDRAHFKSYGDFALIYEVVYYMTDPDYTLYMDTQQAINLSLYRIFAAEGIEFAYPTQTVYVQRVAGAEAGEHRP